MSDYDNLFQIIEELVMHHSPSGVEVWSDSPQETLRDRADNLIAKIPGKNSERAIANCIDLLQKFCTTEFDY